MDWLLFLPQLPSSPSTLRVTVWRRMRAAGAFGFQNGVWMLPCTSENRQFAEEQMAYIKQQGAVSFVFEVTALTPAVEESVLAAIQAERNEEYAEYCERCEALLAELDKETAGEKFTFAELEETETDLHKLESWLDKIVTRDFAGASQKSAAFDCLERCHGAYARFATRVYARQGIDTTDDAPTKKKRT